MGADKMLWRSMMHGVSLLLIFIAFMLLSDLPEPVKCVPHKGTPFSRMNQSFQDQVWKHKFLQMMMDKLMQSDNFPRNSTTPSGQPRGTYTPRSQDNTQFSGTLTQVQLLYNHSAADNLVTDTIPIPKDYVSRFSPPNLVYSESKEKNVLLFRFKPNSIRNNTQVNRINLWLYVWTKDSNGDLLPTSQSSAGVSTSPKTRDLKSDAERGKSIKIRVFLSDENGSRGQRIAELKTRVKSSSWGKLGLPVSLMNSLAETETLRLRVDCKRCSRKTQIVLPGNSDSKRCRKQQKTNKKKKKKHRIRRGRKNCLSIGDTDEKHFPFIVIEEKSRSFTGRFKRTLDTNTVTNTLWPDCHNNSKPNSENSDKTSLLPSSNILQCCTPFKTFVNFADLNLDQVIVYPPGFELSSCAHGCFEPATSFLNNIKRNLEHLLNFPSNKICRVEMGSSEHSSLICRVNHSSRHHLNSQRLQQKHQSHTQRAQWQKHKLGRLKVTSRGCFPVQSHKLVLLHFTRGHELAHLELPSFLVTRCGCKNHLPLIKY